MKLIATILLIAGLAGAQAYIDPSTHAMRVYDIPLGADVGLTLHTDSMHVTDTEQGWALNANTVKVVIVNPNANWLLWRFSDSDVQMLVNDNGDDTIVAPGMIASSPMDSIYFDGEAAITVYVRWWSFDYR